MKLRTLTGLGTLAGIALATLVGLAPANAHNAFVSSSPEGGAIVSEQPGTIVITTSDALLDSGLDSPTTYLQVRGPGAEALYYGDGCATVDGASISMPVALGEPGEYTIAWGAASADGHPITSAQDGGGDIVFTWQPAEGQELGDGLPVPPTCGEVPTASESPAPDEPTAAPAPDATDDASTTPAAEADDASNAASDIVWIGVALGVLVIAAIVVFVVLRLRRPATDPGAPEDDPANPTV